MSQASVWSSPDFTARQVTLNLIFLLKIQILASFSYQAFIFTHFPIILRKKKFRFIGTLTESDLKLLEEQFEQKLSKLQGTIEAQNVNYRDQEVQFQKKMKQQIQEFTDKLNEQRENFNSETILLRTEIKRLNKECTDLIGQLKQAEKEINFINIQLKESPPVSYI